MKDPQIRQMALALLTDDYGISASAYSLLQKLLNRTGNGDLCNRVEGTDDRFYLPGTIMDYQEES